MLAGQLARFLAVGIVNTALSFCAYRLLLLLSIPYPLAAALGFAAGAWNGYVWNRRWTFLARDTNRARFAYGVVQVGGSLTTSLLVYLLHGAGAGKSWAYLAAVPPVTLTMFVLNRGWTFTEAEPVSDTV